MNEQIAYNYGYEDRIHKMNRRYLCTGFEDDYDEGYAEAMDDQENEVNNSEIITNDVDSF